MRKEGKPYKRPPTKRRKTDKAADTVSNNKAGMNLQEEETGSKPSSPVQVRDILWIHLFACFAAAILNVTRSKLGSVILFN